LYREPKKYEEYAYVLDYMPHGRLGSPRTSHSVQGVLQLLGEEYFTLLEASPKPESEYELRERIFVGKGDRALVGHILGRINYKDLTSGSKAELPAIIEIIVKHKEKKIIKFINDSQSLTPRMHSLELIPGIGKRLMFKILELRERYPFESYEDLKARTSLSDPAKLIAKRILKELIEDEKYYIFTRPV
jgi:putative nucleotide binding protein